MTAKEACDFANTKLMDYSDETERAIHGFLQEASTSDIQSFIHCIGTNTRRRWLDIAKTALDARVGRDAERTAQKLITGTDRLVEESVKLTDLTKTLRWLTAVLVFFAFFDFVEFVIRVMEHFCQAPK